MKAIKQSSIYVQNVGSGDRVFRYIIGAALIGLFMAYQATDNRYDQLLAALALISVVVISTAIIRWDPVYAVLGIHTMANTTKRIRNSAVNVGMTDSAVRLAIGSAMIGGFMLFSPTPVGWTVLLPLLAIPVIVTAIIGWCPMYSVAKLNTSRVFRVKKVARPRFIGPSSPRTGHTNAA